jgi:hypothetical protein
MKKTTKFQQIVKWHFDGANVWTLHLNGNTTTEIAATLRCSVRIVREHIRRMRAKVPKGTEVNAMKIVVRCLISKGTPITAVRARIFRVFQMKLTLKRIAAICGKEIMCAYSKRTYRPPKQKEASKMAKKAIKKSPMSVKKATIEAGKKSLMDKPKIKSVCMTTQNNKKTVKKEIKNLKKRIENPKSAKIDGKGIIKVKVTTGGEIMDVLNALTHMR